MPQLRQFESRYRLKISHSSKKSANSNMTINYLN